MSTLGELRRKVQQRLRDFSQKQWEPLELNIILNEAQDLFTRDTQYLHATDIIPTQQGEGYYEIRVPQYYRMANVIATVYFDGVRDFPAMLPVTVNQLQFIDPDWRHRVNAVPLYTIRNYNPYREGVASNNSIYIYPVPSNAISPYTNIETRTFPPTSANSTRIYFEDEPLLAVTSVVNKSTGVAYVENVDYQVISPVGDNVNVVSPYINSLTIPADTAVSVTYTVRPCLRVTYAMSTDGQMVTDDTEMALPEVVAEEALINYTVAEALVRRQLEEPEKASLFAQQAQYYRDKYTDRLIRAATESKMGYSKSLSNTRGYWV